MKKILIACGFFIFGYSIPEIGQCQNIDSLWKAVVFFQDSSKFSINQKIKALQDIEQKTKKYPNIYDSGHALLFSCIAYNYRESGDFINAIKYYKSAISVINTLPDNPLVNPKHLIVNYYRLAVSYDSLGRISDMLNSMDSCYTVARRLRIVDVYCLAALYKRVQYFYDDGDYKRCIEYAEICELLAKEYAGIPGSGQYGMGMNYVTSSFGYRINAMNLLKDYDASQLLLTDKVAEYKKEFAYNLGLVYEQLSEIHRFKKEYDKAIDYHNLAFAAEYKQRHIVNCMTILNNIGYEYSRKSDNKKAIYYYRKALAMSMNNSEADFSDAIESLNIFDGIANAYAEIGAFDEAFKHFELAFDQLKKGMTENDLLNISLDELARQKKVGYLTRLIINKGDAFLKQFHITANPADITNAIKVYKTADLFLDRIRAEQTNIESKLFWRSDSHRLYEHAIEACYAGGNIEEAFYFFEKSRAVLLSDQLKQQKWMGEETIAKQVQIQKKIRQLVNELNSAIKGSPRYNELQNEIFDNNQLLDRLTNLIKAENPLYYQNFIDSDKVNLQRIRKEILNGYQGLIEIFSGDSTVYVLCVANGKNNLRRVQKNIYDSLSNVYISYLSQSSALNKNFKEFIQVSQQFYHLIFNDIVLPKGRLIISPEGQFFPFEALITRIDGSLPVYMVQEYSISYTYSARYLLNEFEKTPDSNARSFMGVAPVNYPSEMKISSLTGSDLSLNRIKSYFSDGVNFIMKDATKGNFLRDFAGCKIIQLYTHATKNGVNDDPEIFFADSSLYLSSLFSGTLPQTRLIVLSACETGLGQWYQGEGVFSFNRGFAALGVPSSVANLWSVENESTYLLTELFYKYLAKKMSPDLALQNAKIEFLKQASLGKRLPYFWAGAIFIGKNETIEFGMENLTKISVAVIAFLFFSSCLIVYFILKKYYKSGVCKRGVVFQS